MNINYNNKLDIFKILLSYIDTLHDFSTNKKRLNNLFKLLAWETKTNFTADEYQITMKWSHLENPEQISSKLLLIDWKLTPE